MNEPLVSVIMPCFNDGRYIEAAVDSVKRQSYHNWELIIVDDGSTDEKTIQILRTFEYDRIKVIYNTHCGVVSARNLGIQNAVGEYIVPIDSDDIADPELISEYVTAMEEDENVGIVYCLYEYFDMRHGIYALPEFNIENQLLSNCINNTSMFRKADWQKIGGYNPNMEMGCEDYDFWLSILELNRQVRFVDKVLLHYRVKQKFGRTNDFDIEREKQVSMQILENHKELYKEHWYQYMQLERNKRLELQNQINNLYKSKYKVRSFLYKNRFIYHLLHLRGISK